MLVILYMKFEGFRFIFYRYREPDKLNKNGNIIPCKGKKFFKAFQKWLELPEQEQEKYRVR